MKIFSKRNWAVLLLSAVMVLTLGVQAWAANSTASIPTLVNDDSISTGEGDGSTSTDKKDDKTKTSTVVKDDSISVSKTQVESGKINISDIKMTAKASEKFVMIDKAAMEYAAQKGLDVGVTTNYMSISFPAKAVTTSAEWKRASNSSPSFNFVIELDDDYTFSNINQALPSATKSKLGCTTFSPKGISLEMYCRGGNKSYVYVNTLNDDATLTYDYAVEYRSASGRPAEKSLALVWADMERKLDSTKISTALLKTKVDTANRKMTVKTPYVCGSYMMVGQTNADNTKTVFAAQVTNPELDGTVNTTGVPAWATANVAAMQEAAVVSSNLSGKDFSAPISRAEFAAYIVRLLNVPQASANGNPFKDVAASNAYYSEILAAANAGLVAGRDTVTFDPNASITRQEMAVMFSRALAYAQVDTSMEMTKLNSMPDVAKVATWAKNSAAICVNAALIAGKDGGAFAPLDNTSWTEAVVMLSRLANMI